jgi:predicted transcriptional regulator
MHLKSEYRDRDDTDVAVLTTLASHPEEGMTVFELRNEVDTDIDSIEESLARLKTEQLIQANKEDGQTVIVPKDYILSNGTGESESESGSIRDWFPF